MNNLPPSQPDFTGGRGALPPLTARPGGLFDSRGRLDTGTASYPSSIAAGGSYPAYRGYADAIMGGRYAAAAGMDPLLQQELRRQDSLLLAGGGGYNDATSAAAAQFLHHPHQRSGAAEASPLLLEEKLLRFHDTHNLIVEAELAARALRDQVAAQQQQAHHAQQQQAAQDEWYLADSIDRFVAQHELQAQQRVRELADDRQAAAHAVSAARGGGGDSWG